MGRANERGPRHGDYKFNLVKIPFVGGDYDRGGAYWGGGRDVAPLYGYVDREEGVYGYLRAWDREEAKREIRSDYPNARFYR